MIRGSEERAMSSDSPYLVALALSFLEPLCFYIFLTAQGPELDFKRDVNVFHLLDHVLQVWIEKLTCILPLIFNSYQAKPLWPVLLFWTVFFFVLLSKMHQQRKGVELKSWRYKIGILEIEQNFLQFCGMKIKQTSVRKVKTKSFYLKLESRQQRQRGLSRRSTFFLFFIFYLSHLSSML